MKMCEKRSLNFVNYDFNVIVKDGDLKLIIRK